MCALRPWKPEEGARSPGMGIADGCVLPEGAGKQIQVSLALGVSFLSGICWPAVASLFSKPLLSTIVSAKDSLLEDFCKKLGFVF